MRWCDRLIEPQELINSTPQAEKNRDEIMSRRVIHSVGIDIGTTTTQVIFSQLELVNRAPASQVPHYEFTRREIVYVSPVVFTPLDANGEVNQGELMRFIQSQYQDAGLDTDKVESGAIIITGV